MLERVKTIRRLTFLIILFCIPLFIIYNNYKIYINDYEELSRYYVGHLLQNSKWGNDDSEKNIKYIDGLENFNAVDYLTKNVIPIKGSCWLDAPPLVFQKQYLLPEIKVIDPLTFYDNGSKNIYFTVIAKLPNFLMTKSLNDQSESFNPEKIYIAEWSKYLDQAPYLKIISIDSVDDIKRDKKGTRCVQPITEVKYPREREVKWYFDYFNKLDIEYHKNWTQAFLVKASIKQGIDEDGAEKSYQKLFKNVSNMELQIPYIKISLKYHFAFTVILFIMAILVVSLESCWRRTHFKTSNNHTDVPFIILMNYMLYNSNQNGDLKYYLH